MESDVVRVIPEELKRLVRLIVRGFYAVEYSVIIDMLVRHPCVKEDDLAELLKFEKKHLRSVLNALKIDKFLKSRMRVETDQDGKTTKHNYYYINYSLFVNVVKFKLDNMRRRIEMNERDNTSRSSFKCPTPACGKTYTDFEVGHLLDPSTGDLICTICYAKVEEDESSVPKEDARTLLARFNEQIQPIYDLLRVCENVKLAPDLLEPEPTDLRNLINPQGRTSSGNRSQGQSGERTVWSGDATRNVDFGFNDNRVTITVGDENAGKVEKKDQPIWMTQSTVDGSSVLDRLPGEVKADSDRRGRGAGVGDDILQTLLVHEQSSSSGPSHPPTAGLGIDEDDMMHGNGQDNSDVEEMGSDEDDDEGPLVTIGSTRVPYNSITSDMVASMTALEKNEYIRIGQELYENMYD